MRVCDCDQANVGIGILGGESSQAANRADIAIDSWVKIPMLLAQFDEKRILIRNIARWTLQKHVMTASTLLSMLLFSAFERIRDPADPIAMALFNASMFIVMATYCKTETLSPERVARMRTSFTKMVVKGFFLGLLNGALVFTATPPEDVENSINALVAVSALQLIFQIRQFKRTRKGDATDSHNQRGWPLWCTLVHAALAAAWLAWLWINLSTTPYAWPLVGILAAFNWLVFAS